MPLLPNTGPTHWRPWPDARFRPTIPLETSLKETLAALEAAPPPGADSRPTAREAALLALLSDRDARALSALTEKIADA